MIALNAMMKEGRTFKNAIARQVSITVAGKALAAYPGSLKAAASITIPHAAHLFRLRRVRDNE